MKTREQIYGQEAAGILRDVSMYHALTETQLLKLYPHKESKIRNLLSYLQKQGRIVQRGEYYRIPADAEESIDHGLSKAVWVLTDFMEQVEYHSVSDYPAKIIFFADGEVYEIIYAEPGKEQLINQMLSTVKEVPPKYIVLIEQPEQIAEIHTPNTSGYRRGVSVDCRQLRTGVERAFWCSSGYASCQSAIQHFQAGVRGCARRRYHRARLQTAGFPKPGYSQHHILQ